MRLYSILKNSLKLTKKELNEYVKNHRITVNGDEVPFTSTIEDIDIVFIKSIYHIRYLQLVD